MCGASCAESSQGQLHSVYTSEIWTRWLFALTIFHSLLLLFPPPRAVHFGTLTRPLLSAASAARRLLFPGFVARPFPPLPTPSPLIRYAYACPSHSLQFLTFFNESLSLFACVFKLAPLFPSELP